MFCAKQIQENYSLICEHQGIPLLGSRGFGSLKIIALRPYLRLDEFQIFVQSFIQHDLQENKANPNFIFKNR